MLSVAEVLGYVTTMIEALGMTNVLIGGLVLMVLVGFIFRVADR